MAQAMVVDHQRHLTLQREMRLLATTGHLLVGVRGVQVADLVTAVAVPLQKGLEAATSSNLLRVLTVRQEPSVVHGERCQWTSRASL